MELNKLIQIGMQSSKTYRVKPEHTAIEVGSGSLKVLATPSLIAFMENTALNLLADHLPQGFSSVGVHIDMHHSAPTPIGGKVNVICQVKSINRASVTFSIKAQDEHEPIGQGQHTRAVIDVGRFRKRVFKKRSGKDT